MREVLLAFIPIFVAMDAVGVLPFLLSFTEGIDVERRKRIIRDSIFTAFTVGVGFLLLGKLIFRFLGVTVSDFKVGGGLILLILAVRDILFAEKRERATGETVGVVPLGVPLIVGPAVMTTLLICHDLYGFWITLLSFTANLSFTWFVFKEAEKLTKLLGESGIRGVAKVTSLLLAAIAVMMIRKGLMEMMGLKVA